MADSEARREARRRKILENAEKRMQRLTNQCSSENENGEKLTNKGNVDNVSSNAIKEEDHKTKTEGLNGPERCEKISTEQEIKQEHAQTELRQRSGARNTVRIQKNIDSTGTDRQTSVDTPKVTSKSETDINLTLKQVEGLKIGSLMLLAIICRLVLKCGFGILYFQSIFLPFIAVEVGWVHYLLTNSLEAPRQRNKMSTVLLLCGIKQDMLIIYDRIMGYVATFSEDFGLFVFSFFISNVLIS